MSPNRDWDGKPSGDFGRIDPRADKGGSMGDCWIFLQMSRAGRPTYGKSSDAENGLAGFIVVSRAGRPTYGRIRKDN